MSSAASPAGQAGFERIRFIMVNPSHAGNVGATARAIKTMGFSDLCLVAPRHGNVISNPEAIARASGAADVLQSAVQVDTLADALAPVTLAFALTARPRVSGPPARDIRAAALQSRDHVTQAVTSRVAFVLGTERAGLSNAHLAMCRHTCHIPANPDYSSLNVAQAAQLVAWELRYALAAGAGLALLPQTGGAVEAGDLPASSDAVQGLLGHLESAMLATGFLDPKRPRNRVEHMRHLFGRCGLSRNETNMLRGFCTAILRSAAKDRDPS